MRTETWAPHGRGSERGAAGEEARDLLVAAFTKVASERGYAATAPADVTAVAGLPPEAYAAHFEDLRQCLLAAYDRFVASLVAEVEEAMDPAAPWHDQVRAAVRAAVAFIAERPAAARLFAVEAIANGPVVIERYEAAMDRIAALLRLGRDCSERAGELPELTERVLVAGASDLVVATLLAEESERFETLETELTDVLLLPYLPEGSTR